MKKERKDGEERPFIFDYTVFAAPATVTRNTLQSGRASFHLAANTSCNKKIERVGMK
jgi:hypothetical protein